MAISSSLDSYVSLRTRALLGLVPSQSQAECCPTGEDNLRPFPKALLSDLLSSLAEKKGVCVLFLPPPSLPQVVGGRMWRQGGDGYLQGQCPAAALPENLLSAYVAALFGSDVPKKETKSEETSLLLNDKRHFPPAPRSSQVRPRTPPWAPQTLNLPPTAPPPRRDAVTPASLRTPPDP